MTASLVRQALRCDLGTDKALKLVLIALCDHANPDGTNAYPSRALLAEYAGLSTVRSVGKKLAELTALGLITHTGRHTPRGSAIFDIDIDALADTSARSRRRVPPDPSPRVPPDPSPGSPRTPGTGPHGPHTNTSPDDSLQLPALASLTLHESRARLAAGESLRSVLAIGLADGVDHAAVATSALWEAWKRTHDHAPVWSFPGVTRIIRAAMDAGYDVELVAAAAWRLQKRGAPITRSTIQAELAGVQKMGDLTRSSAAAVAAIDKARARASTPYTPTRGAF